MKETVIIILLSLALIGLVSLIIITLTKKQNIPQGPSVDLKEIGALSNQINNISSELKKDIEITLTKQFYQDSETNNAKLERFQNGISENLNKRFDALNKQMDEKITEINNKVDQRLQDGFKGTSETIAQVRERLQAIDDAQKNIENLSKDVISLKSVLEGNQTRGRYGEYQLSMVLHNVFGDSIGCYKEQFTLKKTRDGDDVRADAVVFMPEPNKMICIDSKFPFSDYSKIFETSDSEEKERLTKAFGNAVHKHITDIKDKYIVDGKTARQAMMFIPNDGVFAFIHHDLTNIVDYARSQNVIMTSPSTLPAMLFTINMVKIEAERAKNAQEVSKQIQKLSKDFEMFGREWDTFSNSLDSAFRNREKIDSRVSKLTGKFEAIKVNNVIEGTHIADETLIDEK